MLPSTIPFGSYVLRCPYEGDVPGTELETRAKCILSELEREYGAKIPKIDTDGGLEMFAKRHGEGAPVFGDMKASLDRETHFAGRVGDLSITIHSAEPRYAKKDGKYVITCKGAVVVNIVQSPGTATCKAEK